MECTNEKEVYRVTLAGSAINAGLVLFKLVAGFLGNSAAMIADGVHSLSDFLTDIVVIVFVRISNKPQDKDHDYGHGKFETLATVVVSLMLLVVGAEMIKSSYQQIRSAVEGNPLPAPEMIALWAAVISIISKEFLYQWTVKVGKRLSSPVVIANAWHHRTDALSSVGSLIGIAGAIALGGEWTILDPLVGAVISIVIIVMAVKMSIPALAELTEASLPEKTEQKMLEIIRSVEGVRGVHELKTRLCGHYCIADFHIVVAPETTILESHETTVIIERKLREEFGEETQINIHVEPSDDSL